MSLQYIIDGYNVIRHPSFNFPKVKDERVALVEFIKSKRPCGSLRNKIIIVFDGNFHMPEQSKNSDSMDVIFTKKETADEWIKRRIESEANPKNTIVVSDDKEIKFFVKSVGGRAIGVDEFINRKAKSRGLHKKDAEALASALKPELTYSQIDQINRELKKIWLE